MASEIKPGRGLTTKLTADIPGSLRLFTNTGELKCLDPTIFSVTYASTFLLAAVVVCSDLNIDGCRDNHGVPLFVLSLLGSYDSVSLCVVLLDKIRFVYDFVIIQM